MIWRLSGGLLVLHGRGMNYIPSTGKKKEKVTAGT
jgi:hypothetical protein